MAWRLRFQKPTEAPRRRFLIQGAAMLAAGLGLWTRQLWSAARNAPLRPPGASMDDELFVNKCIRCGLCGTVCENGCIRFSAADDMGRGPRTPYLDVRSRSCTLCMRCTNVCPSGALAPIAAMLPEIEAKVKIGKAVVDPEHCISYLGRLCGYCHDACPIPKAAIRLTPPALPVVLDGCVGCGRCVELCPQNPAAIRVERLG